MTQASTSLLPFHVGERRRAVAGPLSTLADALANELTPWFDRALPIPEHKARLTRIGGWCPNEGAMLTFDPVTPHDHRCPVCGQQQRGLEHDQYWAMGAQLWLAERAAQSAALFVVREDAQHRQFALRILSELAARYDQWPNRDNVLGPSRPFFSTYLESIWLLNLCHTMALLESMALPPEAWRTLDRVRDTLVAPSAALIATFHEGRSNRQVWNDVALMSASRVLHDERAVLQRLTAADGFFDLLDRGLLDDGTWYEGENYHLFAHRGLWYGVELACTLGHALPPKLERKFVDGFASPFLGLLPDDTFPSRRDSKYAVSIRQWRSAEWCELGLLRAREGTRHARVRAALAGILARLYDASFPRGDTGRARSTADAERNEPPSALSRADLSWRALLSISQALPTTEEWYPGSICLPEQGLAVVRRDRGRTYVALDGGHTGGGHGHPDRLALTLQHNRTRWLEDPGTGSYVSRTLHWYRSTLAHAAPLMDGASQLAVPATLIAFDDQPEATLVVKRVEGLANGVTVQRTLVVCNGYLVDLLEWHPADDHAGNGAGVGGSASPASHATVPHHVCILPVARAATTNVTAWRRAEPQGAGALEDGFGFLRDVERAPWPMLLWELAVKGHAPHDAETSGTARVWYAVSDDASVWRAVAPGPPECADRPLHWINVTANAGRVLGVWSWTDTVERVALDVKSSQVVVTMRDSGEHRHAPVHAGWRVSIVVGDGTRHIDLAWRPEPATVTESGMDAIDGTEAPVRIGALLAPALLLSRTELAAEPLGATLVGASRVELAAAHYRQTELPWTDAERPTARVQVGMVEGTLVIDVQALFGPPTVLPADENNPLDNERADVNADGIQLYIGSTPGQPWRAAWLIVPSLEAAPMARVTPLVPAAPPIGATWARTSDGWAIRMLIAREVLPPDTDGALAFDLIVNQRGAGRERRLGQLVLSGGGGFAYLRGDRNDPAHAWRLQLL